MKRQLSVLLTVAGLCLGIAGTASASLITGGDILGQFNLVVLGDLDSQSHVDGRTYVGGNLTGGAADFFQHGNQAAPSHYAALTVRGNVSGADKKVNSGGDAVIGGNVGSLTMNGGGQALVTGRISGGRTVMCGRVRRWLSLISAVCSATIRSLLHLGRPIAR